MQKQVHGAVLGHVEMEMVGDVRGLSEFALGGGGESGELARSYTFTVIYRGLPLACCCIFTQMGCPLFYKYFALPDSDGDRPLFR